MTRTTIPDLLSDHADARPEETFLVTERDEYSYAAVDRLTKGLAANLLDAGVEPGDHLAAALENSDEYLLLILAASRIGAVVANVNPEYGRELMEYAVDVTDSVAFFFDDATSEHYPAVTEATDDLRFSVGVRTDAGDARRFDAFLEEREEVPDVDVSFGDPSQITFSSGTTGDPKPILLSQNFWLQVARAINERLDVDRSDRVFANLTMAHGNPYIGLYAALRAGGSVALGYDFSASSFWDEVREFEATVLAMHVTTANILLKYEDDRDHPADRAAFVAGTQAEPFMEKFGLDRLISAYGSMEAGGLCNMATLTLEEARDVHDNMVGRPREDFHVQVVDDDDVPLPRGEAGEIVTRPAEPHVMYEEYYNMPEKTVSVSRNLWYHSGDVGYIDEEGRLHFIGRDDDSIRVKGQFVPIERVERTIRTMDDVDDCAIVGVPGDIDDDVKAYVKVSPGASVSPEAVVEACRADLASHMVPRYVEFVEELPRSESIGKIQRGTLAEQGIGDAWERPDAG